MSGSPMGRLLLQLAVPFLDDCHFGEIRFLLQTRKHIGGTRVIWKTSGIQICVRYILAGVETLRRGFQLDTPESAKRWLERTVSSRLRAKRYAQERLGLIETNKAIASGIEKSPDRASQAARAISRGSEKSVHLVYGFSRSASFIVVLEPEAMNGVTPAK